MTSSLRHDDVSMTAGLWKIPDEGEKDYGRYTWVGFGLIENKIWPVHIFFFDILFAQLGLDSEGRWMITGTKTELKGRYEEIMSDRYVYLKLF